MMATIRRYLISGLFVWLPLWVTYLILSFLVGLMDHTLNLIPAAYRPEALLGFRIPGVGILFTLLLLFFTGMFAANFLGKRFVNLWHKFIRRIPLVRSIYLGVQQVLETLLSPKGKAFRKVLLVEYPRKGMWSIAFQTAEACQEANDAVKTEMITIFIPTTPNPTSGFLMMIPREEAHELGMSVDQALKMVISLGVVQPGKDFIEGKKRFMKDISQ